MNDSEAEARVRSAMAFVPRAGFLRHADRDRADHDGPLPIGHGQTNSQPRTVADMLVLLDPRPGHRVLDVGAGSGWTTALLAHLVGPPGSVLGVELRADLAGFGAANLRAAQLPWATIVPAEPHVLGAPDAAPFDRILCSAEAGELPISLVDQLVAGGVLVLPVRGRMLRVTRTRTAYEVERHGWYRFVPLVQDP